MIKEIINGTKKRIPLCFNNGKADSNELTKELNYFLCGHHLLFSYDMLYLNTNNDKNA